MKNAEYDYETLKAMFKECERHDSYSMAKKLLDIYGFDAEQEINLRTSDELYTQLSELSVKNNKSLSETIRIALTDYVNKQNNKYAEFESYLNQGE